MPTPPVSTQHLPVLLPSDRCSSFACQDPARGFILAPDGRPIPGAYCRSCGSAAAAESAAVLDPAWIFLDAPRLDTAGHVVPPTPAHSHTVRAVHAAALARYAAIAQAKRPQVY